MTRRASKSSIGPAILFFCLLLMMFAVPSPEAASPEYPARAITMIVPYPAGGQTDLGARAFAESMEKHLKQPMVVVNKVGGGTTVGGYALSSSKPDGYTLGFFPPFAAILKRIRFSRKHLTPAETSNQSARLRSLS